MARHDWHIFIVITITLDILLATTVANSTIVNRANASEEPNWKTFIVRAGGQSYPIQYSITGGRVVDMVPNVETSDFTVIINSTADGKLTIKLPRELVDSRTGEDWTGEDVDFAVFVDEEIAEANEIEATSTTRTLSIDFAEGTEEIVIVGTWRPYLLFPIEWTAHIVGKFLNSEPPKPDQIFKIKYRIINGTMENFDIQQEIDGIFVHNSITIKVNSGGNGVLEIKFPRNFPFTNSNDGIGDFAFLAHGEGPYPEHIKDERTATDCFFVFSVPFEGSVEIEMPMPSILIKSPYHGDNVPDSCIPQTIVENVPVRKDGTITPLQQFRAGVAAEDVICRQTQPDGKPFMLLISPDGKPYCVKISNEEFMKARGWTEPNQE